MSELTLTVNGKAYGGWQTVQVRQSIAEVCPSFQVQHTDRWQDGAKLPIPSPAPRILRGDTVALKIDGDLVLTGYVDEVTEDADSRSRRLGISGRAKTCDLVDSAPKLGTFKRQTVKQIAESVAGPFGITVTTDPIGVFDPGPRFERVVPEPGETGIELLGRLATQRNIILQTNAPGALVLAKVATLPSAGLIEWGRNVLRSSYRDSGEERFSEYTFRGQTGATETNHGAAASQNKGTVTDTEVTRHRPLHLVSHGAREDLGARAIWERNRRAARGESFTYSMQGWHDESGALWRPNTLVGVIDKRYGVQTQLLVSAVTLTKDIGGGTIAEVQVCAKEAYAAEPPKRIVKGGGLSGLKIELGYL